MEGGLGTCISNVRKLQSSRSHSIHLSICPPSIKPAVVLQLLHSRMRKHRNTCHPLLAMSHPPDPDYLRPGFNPSSVTMARLRSILVTHDVSYASNATKSQLAALVTDRILPRAPGILAARQNIIPSAEGITDAIVSQTVKTPSQNESRASSQSHAPTHSRTRSHKLS